MFVEHDGRILVLRESSDYKEGAHLGKFDIVGGRLKPGENFYDGTRREVMEETGLDVKLGKPFFINEWRPTVNGEKWQIIGIFLTGSADSDKVVLSVDHSAFKWIDPADYRKHSVIENLYPAFDAYLGL
ncbi:MAG: NUDIX domain-containing protein [Candidatus Micrarchaeota archaeon]|nr:NUDIX domain-containing protein [Candidatus Micrarchaeota archaeon]